MKKREIYIQKGPNYCGACSIASIVSHYGGYVPLETVITDTLTDKSGTNAYEIVRVLKSYGIDAYGMRIILNNLKHLRLPLIAHTLKNGYEHFLVIYEFIKDKVITMDPEFGKKVYSMEEFNSIYNGIVIVCNPSSNIAKFEKKSTLKDMFKDLFKREKKCISLVIIQSIFVILLSILSSFYIKIGFTSSNLSMIFYSFLGIIIFKFIIDYIRISYRNSLGIRIDRYINEVFIRHVFSLKLQYLSNKRVGEIAKKLSDIILIKDVFLRIVLVNALDVILILFGLIMLSFISIRLTIVLTITLVLYYVISLFEVKKLNGLNTYNLYDHNAYYGNLIEFLEGIESIKNINSEKEFISRLNDSYDKYLCDVSKIEKCSNRYGTLKRFIDETGFIVLYTIGITMIKTNTFTLLDLLTFSSLSSLVFSSFENIINTMPEFIKSKSVFRATSEFLDVDMERCTGDMNFTFKKLKIDNLTYSYDYYRDTLKNFNLSIDSGEKILLNGPSGIGKSTLAKCMSGYIDGYAGNISFNDCDLNDISLASLRKHVIYIGQNEKIFSTSIKDNICMGLKSEEGLNKVARLVRLDSVIDKRIEKENSSILEGGANLSGGEKARIFLARALYRKPDILIIDETLSSISEDMEDAIIRDLLKLDNLTLIYITHRDKSHLFKKILSFRKEGIYEITK